MSRMLTLAKVVVVNGVETLGPKFIDYYYPEIDMYIFFTETLYDPDTGRHKGKLLLHDRLMADLKMPFVADNSINFVSIDIRRDDPTHTYLSANKHYYHLNSKQLDFLMKMFDVDFCKSKAVERTVGIS